MTRQINRVRTSTRHIGTRPPSMDTTRSLTSRCPKDAPVSHVRTVISTTNTASVASMEPFEPYGNWGKARTATRTLANQSTRKATTRRPNHARCSSTAPA